MGIKVHDFWTQKKWKKPLMEKFHKTYETIFMMVFFLCIFWTVVEEVRTVFERINDATIYIPSFEMRELI